MNPSAVVLAGGFGTRLRSVLPDLPKPMAPVAGCPFVEWVVRYLRRERVAGVVLSTGYKAETIAAHFAANPVPEIRTVCVEETVPLGTAGGFLNCIKHSGIASDAWLVLNGDSLALAPLAPLFGLLNDPAVDAAVLALWMDDASRYGSLAIEAGQLQGFLEKRPGASWINAGVYLFRAKTLDLFPEKSPLSFETDVFPALLAAGCRIAVHQVAAPFLDIGLPESLAQADDFIGTNRAAFD